MANQIEKYFERLKEDEFRKATPFSKHLEETKVALLNSGSPEQAEEILCSWLRSNQPCLFGRIAARFSGLSFCFLREADLVDADETIHEKIQIARRAWRRKAFQGDASGFLIVVLSDRIARAVPDDAVKSLAKRICYLYLGRDDEDAVLLEDVFLRVPGREDAEIHWKAGVNYFSANADGRWWHDHRIPGGMAFSVNSVGHMVKAFQVARSSEEMWKNLGLSQEDWANLRVDSLDKALVNAMLTIDNAATTKSGKATHLVQRHDLHGEPSDCPVHLPAKLEDKSCSDYFGYYHTDFTLPSEYFRPDVDRPSDLNGYSLDFTYLFSDHVDNPAFAEMGRGIRVRRRLATSHVSQPRLSKHERVRGEEGPINDHPQLKQALEEVC